VAAEIEDGLGGSRALRAARLALRNFRNYEQAEVRLADGVSLVHGQVGAGKTNLLEALCFACTGRSLRGGGDRDLIRFGSRAAYVSLTTVNDVGEQIFEAGLELGRPKVIKVDGVKRGRMPDAAGRPLLCVFLPDRLELVKGPASVRREYFDGVVSGVWPARRAARSSYARALAQRNVLVKRARGEAAPLESLTGWNRELARWGVELMDARSSAVELLRQWFGEHAAGLGLGDDVGLSYRPRSRASTVEELEQELAVAAGQDVERGFTTHGPHRDDFRLELGGRELRRFGSQGQQRLGLLALLLAERDALRHVRGITPILLLDDVLSELDRKRRERLLGALDGDGQSLITTADLRSAHLDGYSFATLRIDSGSVDA
jgi:DNA replication and repair protein RecF